MKIQVSLYKAGKLWTEEYHSSDFEDARKIALARNPGATITGVSANLTADQIKDVPDYFKN
tara:strand:- start:8390 stop:8572 length:183 start_codon:yes stop_codon:yes gene_type:complete